MKRAVSVITKLNALLAVLFLGMAGLAGFAWSMLPPADRGLFLSGAAGWTAVVMLLALALRLSIRAGILRSIRAAAHVIGRVAEGDLTARVGIQAHGETQKMLRGLEQMTADLALIVGRVADSSRTVAARSAQIAHGHRELSARTEHQASTLEETASSLEELTSTVALNADTAREASDLAREAAGIAERGGAAVADVVRTMQGISASAGRIGEISSVIDGIAFQTNLLALNAAVEAARAGEQGRGFAVVAAEVRSLSQRCAEAAREIKGLIGDAVAKVDDGSRLVETAGGTMEEVVTSVRRVNALIGDIAGASREQSAGIVQINTAIAEMEQGVQQNASLVQEAAEATASLAEQAEDLQRLVARFQLADTPPQAAARSGTAPPRPAQAAAAWVALPG